MGFWHRPTASVLAGANLAARGAQIISVDSASAAAQLRRRDSVLEKARA